MKRFALVSFVVAFAAMLVSAGRQSAVAYQGVESVVGAVEQRDRNSKTATLKTDSGEIVKLTADDSTLCLRIPAGEKTLSKAAPIKFEDITIGDRVLAHGMKGERGFVAQRLVVMPVAEVAKKREHDLDEWKRRGIGGVVREVNHKLERSLWSCAVRAPERALRSWPPKRIFDATSRALSDSKMREPAR